MSRRDGRKSRGALFYAVACKRDLKQAKNTVWPSLVCPCCEGISLEPMKRRVNTDEVEYLNCRECKTVYPVLNGVPILHPEFRDFK